MGTGRDSATTGPQNRANAARPAWSEDRLTSHWKYAAVIAGLILSFVAGRFLSPQKIETRTEYKTLDHYLADTSEVVRLSEQLRRAEERIASFEASTHRHTRTVITPDRIETETTEDTRAATVERVVETVEVVRTSTVYVDRVVERRVEHEGSATKVVESRPNWSIAAKAGVSVTALTLEQPIIVGADVGFRLVGGVWVEAWGLSNGVAGLGVRVDL